ncbi:MAG TPA: FxsA family protein [Bdellovibrionales bacterium]|nr:FxsA family protein [Bdellovibrionales bacterium]
MIIWLFLLFTMLPVLEIAVLIRVGSWLGFWETLGIMIAMGFIGAWLAKREGRRAFFEIQAAAARGQMPANEILEGFMIFLGGLLMVTPGFITDVVGLLFVFPPTRKLALHVMKRVIGRRIVFQTMVYRPQHPNESFRRESVQMRDVTPKPAKSGGPEESPV